MTTSKKKLESLTQAEEIYLTPEQDEALDRVWEKRAKEAQLELQGIGPPRWDLGRARYERPTFGTADLEEWVRIANDEYRRLRMAKVAGSEADRLSILTANAKFPTK